jgi:hypothetical protein
MIFDLSSPEDSSVNDGIAKHYGSISYETLADVIRLVTKAGKGAVMMKRDLKSAFRHIPISPHDYWLMIFEWEGKFYVNMFLPFGLRTAPRVFNYFSEALHWVLEMLLGWDITHYLDDFFIVFPPDSDISRPSEQFDQTLVTFGLQKAAQKDSSGCIVSHLGFQFDSVKMQVTLPANKKERAFRAVHSLLSKPSTTHKFLEEVLGFLSHCCQVVPLGRPFLCNISTLLARSKHSSRHCIHLSSAAKIDLRWWSTFLSSWSSVSMIQPSRENHDVATDASGTKGIWGIYRRALFSERVPSHHTVKHINWKEMYAILHAFVLWHKDWANGKVRLACDNSVVVDAIHKQSIAGPAIRPLQTILLIAAVFDIDLVPFWIPLEENTVADAASRHNFTKIANLGFQDQISSLRHRNPSAGISALHQRLLTSFTMPLPLPHDRTTTPLQGPINPSASSTNMQTSLSQLNPSLTGLPNSCTRSSKTQQSPTSKPSGYTTLNTVSVPTSSKIPVSTQYSEVEGAFTVKPQSDYGFHSQLDSLKELSMRSNSTLTASTSKQPSVWRLPPSFDLASLRGIPGTQTHPHPPISLVSMSDSTHSQ